MPTLPDDPADSTDTTPTPTHGESDKSQVPPPGDLSFGDAIDEQEIPDIEP